MASVCPSLAGSCIPTQTDRGLTAAGQSPPLSSLDPRIYPSSSTDDERDDVAWRFRSSRAERDQVLAALKAHFDADSQKRARRLQLCGAHATVWHSPSTHATEVRAYHCGLRSCPECRHTHAARARERIHRFAVLCPPGSLSFLTLTLRSTSAPLGIQLDNLIAAFRRLRSSKLWKSLKPAGYAAVEITYSAELHMWHPHVHCLLQIPYVAQAQLSTAWSKASRGSAVVDIRRVKQKDQEHAINYVTSYMVKAPDEALHGDPALLWEWLTETHHRRFSIRIGKPELAPKPEPEPDPGDWCLIGTLGALARAAKHMHPRALYWLKLLTETRVKQSRDPDAGKDYRQEARVVYGVTADYEFYEPT